MSSEDSLVALLYRIVSFSHSKVEFSTLSAIEKVTVISDLIISKSSDVDLSKYFR